MQMHLDFSSPAVAPRVAALHEDQSPPANETIAAATRPDHVPTRRPPEVYTRAEIEPVLAACPPNVFGCRHRALIVLLWRSGLRISEALSICLEDLDPEAGLVRVRRGKGGRARMAAADPETFVVVGEWIALRRARRVSDDAPLFCSLDGTPVFAASVRRTMTALRRRAGLHKRVHAHAFRHTHAAELWYEGVPERLIQVQLGHRSLDTTAKYLTRIGVPADLAAMSRARQPWRRPEQPPT